MTTNVVFTRYLYNDDEVVLTFIESLLSKKELTECYFWISEYYKSGFEVETWNLLWKIYYDFYALNYPKLETKIKQYYNKWKEDNRFIHVMNVVINYYRFSNNTSYDVFLLRVYYCNRLFTLFKRDTEFRLMKYDYKNKYETLLVRAIVEKCWKSISFYLKKCIKSPHLMDSLEKILERKIKVNENYDNLFHQLLVNIIMNDPKKSDYYFKKANTKDFNSVIEADISCRNDGKHEDISYVYKTLPQIRLYGISSKIGCFKLKRRNVELNKIFWYHWEYFASFSPLWRGRFDKYELNIDHENKIINFINDEDCEEYYEAYGYEPDEQSKEVQELSTKEIPYIRLDTWINKLFKNKLARKIRTKIEY